MGTGAGRSLSSGKEIFGCSGRTSCQRFTGWEKVSGVWVNPSSSTSIVAGGGSGEKQTGWKEAGAVWGRSQSAGVGGRNPASETANVTRVAKHMERGRKGPVFFGL